MKSYEARLHLLCLNCMYSTYTVLDFEQTNLVISRLLEGLAQSDPDTLPTHRLPALPTMNKVVIDFFFVNFIDLKGSIVGIFSLLCHSIY